jgi:hypothetical protein
MGETHDAAGIITDFTTVTAKSIKDYAGQITSLSYKLCIGGMILAYAGISEQNLHTLL